MHARYLSALFNEELAKRGLAPGRIGPIQMLPGSIATLLEVGKQPVHVEPLLQGRSQSFWLYCTNLLLCCSLLFPHLPSSVLICLHDSRFIKHNDNDGNISTTDDVPQAFSHFTFHVSGGSVLVCDIQGVKFNYTGAGAISKRGWSRAGVRWFMCC